MCQGLFEKSAAGRATGCALSPGISRGECAGQGIGVDWVYLAWRTILTWYGSLVTRQTERDWERKERQGETEL